MFLPMRQRALLVIVAVAAWSAGCASLPVGTYYPSPADPNTVRVAHILHRAAVQRAIEILRAMGNPSPRRSLAESLRAVDAVLVRTRDEGGSVLDTHPTLEDRLKALEPLEPAAVAEVPSKKR